MHTKDIITNEDKLKWAIHTQELEGYTVDQKTIEDCKKIINGEIDADANIAEIKKRFQKNG